MTKLISSYSKTHNNPIFELIIYNLTNEMIVLAHSK